MTILTVQPAYGRSYSSEEEILIDWDKDLDFKILGGPYVNKQQIKELITAGYTAIEFYFTFLRASSFVLEI